MGQAEWRAASAALVWFPALASIACGTSNDSGGSAAGGGSSQRPSGTAGTAAGNGTAGTAVGNGTAGTASDSGGAGTASDNGTAGTAADNGTAGTAAESGGAGGTAGTAHAALGGTAGAREVGVAASGGCDFDIEADISAEIGTVGIVQWAVGLPEVERAEIQFGPDTDYGMTAPVDTSGGGNRFRTLLLGMKANREYHFKIRAHAGDADCSSGDRQITTGPLATNLPNVSVDTEDADAVAGGFLVTGTTQGGPVYILDADGDFVWWHDIPAVTRARMSYDGNYMWMGMGGGGSFLRVSMDGEDVEDFEDDFKGYTHDFAILPDETVAFLAADGVPYADGECQQIAERAPDGTVHKVLNLRPIFTEDTRTCHANAIHYSPEDDTYVVSDPTHFAYVKVTREGEVVWVLGGETTDFPDFAETFLRRQHGFHILDLNRLLIFNNTRPNEGDVSRPVELELDLEAMDVTEVWAYEPDPPLNNGYLGDVQRLPNGNTLVTFSAQGVIHELDPDGKVVETTTLALGDAIGYTMKRTSLYGPPPK